MAKSILKKDNFLTKTFIMLTYLALLMLIISYIFPFIPPKTLGRLASLSLLTPVVLMINLFFLVYWLLRMRRYFWYIFLVIALGFPYIYRLFGFFGEKKIQTNDIKLMSYNVRMFNLYEWSDDKEIPQKIAAFITEKSPDILLFQDYAVNNNVKLDFPYSYTSHKTNQSKFGLAIFSKFPMVQKGSLDLPNTANNIIFTDLKIDQDTVRVYNVHLQSMKLNTQKDYFGADDAQQLRERISTTFHKQQEQVELLLAHQAKCPYKVIFAGDFNNTAYSWVYQKMLHHKNDAFVKSGTGLDRTYDFFFPLRIDFVLADKSLNFNYFTTYKVKYSDHYPIMARIERPLHEKQTE